VKQLLSDAIDDYMGWRKSNGYSKSYLHNETIVLKKLLGTVGNIYVHNLHDGHVTRHFEDSGRTRSPASLRIDHATLNGFFDWSRRTKRAPASFDPMNGRRPPRPMKRERRRIPVAKFGHLLDVGERIGGPRDRAVVAMFLYTLLREQEVASLRIADVDLDGGWLHTRIFKSKTEDTMPISQELDTELRLWLTEYQNQCGPLQPEWFLIPARRKGATERDGRGRIARHTMILTPEARVARLGDIIRLILTEFGFAVRDMDGSALMEGAHTIRRSGARALFDSLSGEGHDFALRIVQSMLHHKSMTTTELYIGVTADRRTRDDLIRGRRMYAVSGSKALRAVQ
jgi:integrase